MRPAPARRQLTTLIRDRRNAAVPGLAATYLLLFGPLALFAAAPGWGTGALAFLLVGLMQYRLVLVSHEAVHGTLLTPDALSEAVGLVSASLIGVNFHRYRVQHFAHHRARTVAEDPDAYIYRPILEARPGLRRIAALVLGMVPEALEKMRQEGPGRGPHHAIDPATARRHSLCVLAANGALFGALTLAVGWWAWPLLWAAPLGSVALLLNRVRVFVEHGHAFAGAEGWGGDLGDQPVRTVDLRSHPLERFFLAGFAFHHHHVHHRVPGVPHYYLRHALDLLAREEAGYPPVVDRTYVGALGSMLRGR